MTCWLSKTSSARVRCVTDRLLFVWLYASPSILNAIIIVQLETVIRSHSRPSNANRLGILAAAVAQGSPARFEPDSADARRAPAVAAPRIHADW